MFSKWLAFWETTVLSKLGDDSLTRLVFEMTRADSRVVQAVTCYAPGQDGNVWEDGGCLCPVACALAIQLDLTSVREVSRAVWRWINTLGSFTRSDGTEFLRWIDHEDKAEVFDALAAQAHLVHCQRQFAKTS